MASDENAPARSSSSARASSARLASRSTGPPPRAVSPFSPPPHERGLERLPSPVVALARAPRRRRLHPLDGGGDLRAISRVAAAARGRLAARLAAFAAAAVSSAAFPFHAPRADATSATSATSAHARVTAANSRASRTTVSVVVDAHARRNARAPSITSFDSGNLRVNVATAGAVAAVVRGSQLAARLSTSAAARRAFCSDARVRRSDACSDAFSRIVSASATHRTIRAATRDVTSFGCSRARRSAAFPAATPEGIVAPTSANRHADSQSDARVNSASDGVSEETLSAASRATRASRASRRPAGTNAAAGTFSETAAASASASSTSARNVTPDASRLDIPRRAAGREREPSEYEPTSSSEVRTDFVVGSRTDFVVGSRTRLETRERLGDGEKSLDARERRAGGVVSRERGGGEDDARHVASVRGAEWRRAFARRRLDAAKQRVGDATDF